MRTGNCDWWREVLKYAWSVYMWTWQWYINCSQNEVYIRARGDIFLLSLGWGVAFESYLGIATQYHMQEKCTCEAEFSHLLILNHVNSLAIIYHCAALFIAYSQKNPPSSNIFTELQPKCPALLYTVKQIAIYTHTPKRPELFHSSDDSCVMQLKSL